LPTLADLLPEKLGVTPDGSHGATVEFSGEIRRAGSRTHGELLCSIKPPMPKRRAPSAYPTIGFAGQRPKKKYDGYRYSLCPEFAARVDLVRWASWIWPSRRTLCNADGAKRLVQRISWFESEWEDAYFLDPLLDSCEPIDGPATLMIAAALCCKRPHETARGVDVAISALEQGRLDGQRLGGAMRLLLSYQMAMPARWVKTLSEIADCSTLLQLHVLDAIDVALCCDDVGKRRGLSDLLQFYFEQCSAIGARPVRADAIAALKQIGGSSKAGKLARSLLALEAKPEFAKRRQAAAALALAQRLDADAGRYAEIDA